ncbi:MAG: putative CRISPR-associated protein, partial [Candidatus Njordarchaeota archaeon]
LDSIDNMSPEDEKRWEKEILSYLKEKNKDIKKTSAEMASIFSILENENLKDIDQIDLMFIVSDTAQGKLVYNIYKNFFEGFIKSYNGKQIRCYYDIAEGLTYTDLEHVAVGLPTVPILLSQWIRNNMGMGHKVVLNVTGGFKAECIYAALVGIMADIPTYYMHEKFKKVIMLPPLPDALIRKPKEQVEIFFHIVEKFYKDLKQKIEKTHTE